MQKKGSFISISSRQLLNESRVSWRLCLTFCSVWWLTVILRLAKNFNPSVLWMPNIELGDGLISLRIRWSCECWSQVLTSFTFRKKEIWKANALVFSGWLFKAQCVWVLLVGWDIKEQRYEGHLLITNFQ